MNTLFPEDHLYPKGFQYYPNFLSAEEETRLNNEILKHSLHSFMFQGYKANRKVASFGYDYNFEIRRATKGRIYLPASAS
jgi:hypothetical protein